MSKPRRIVHPSWHGEGISVFVRFDIDAEDICNDLFARDESATVCDACDAEMIATHMVAVELKHATVGHKSVIGQYEIEEAKEY